VRALARARAESAVVSGSWSGSCLSIADYVAMPPPTNEVIAGGCR
jgi:hypothetical protein